MAWDKSNGMYYRTKRRGKRVEREYFGNGDAAALAASLDNLKRLRKQEERAVVDTLRRQWSDACKPLEELRDGTLLLMQAVCLITQRKVDLKGVRTVTAQEGERISELRRLVALGATGDTDVLPEIRRLLDQHPEIVNHFGDVAKVATELWLSLYDGHGSLVTEATRRKMLLWRVSVAGPVPTPLESLLIDQIVVHWLQTYATEALYAQAIAANASAAILREKRQQIDASRRWLADSLRQLAQLRELLPALPDDPLRMLHIPKAVSPDDAGSTPSKRGPRR